MYKRSALVRLWILHAGTTGHTNVCSLWFKFYKMVKLMMLFGFNTLEESQINTDIFNSIPLSSSGVDGSFISELIHTAFFSIVSLTGDSSSKCLYRKHGTCTQSTSLCIILYIAYELSRLHASVCIHSHINVHRLHVHLQWNVNFLSACPSWKYFSSMCLIACIMLKTWAWPAHWWWNEKISLQTYTCR